MKGYNNIDVLTISYSSTDYNQFGPHAHEIEDTYLKLDIIS